MMGNSRLLQPKFDAARGSPFHETWYLKVLEPVTRQALFLQFQILRSSNRFKQVAEIKAITCRRASAREVTKLGLGQSFDLRSFSFKKGEEGEESNGGSIAIGPCSLSQAHSKGSLQSKGQSIDWDLRFAPSHETENLYFRFEPPFLTPFMPKDRVSVTPAPDLRITGIVRIDGETITLREAPGMLGHVSGPRQPHGWAWTHCNAFVNERGAPVTFSFEAISAKNRAFKLLPIPSYNACMIFYEGKAYRADSFSDPLGLRSRDRLTEWEVSAEQGGLSFRAALSAEFREFAGITLEDTNGSALYASLSLLSNLEVRVYRRGRLEAAFYGNGTASYEICGRKKNPYVPSIV